MPTHSHLFVAAVELAKQQIKEVSIAETQELLQQSPAPLLIDVREDLEWQAGHLPCAIHIGKGVLERDIEKTLPNLDTPMILYCGGGSRSALAAHSLQQMGYTQAMSMNGGFRSWIAAGLPITKPTPDSDN